MIIWNLSDNFMMPARVGKLDQKLRALLQSTMRMSSEWSRENPLPDGWCACIMRLRLVSIHYYGSGAPHLSHNLWNQGVAAGPGCAARSLAPPPFTKSYAMGVENGSMIAGRTR
jgi:hypothetical protein